jgi:NADH-quinone oxidoreductase subunit C
MGLNDDPDAPDTTTPPEAAADKPAGSTPAEPLKGEVSRTDAPAAGASAAPVAPPRTEPPAPKPVNPAGAQTATTSETSSATGQPTAPAAAVSPQPPAASAARPAAPAGAATRPAAPAGAAAKPAAPAHPPAAAPPSGPPDPPPPAGTTTPAFITSLQAAIPGGVSALSYWVGDWTIIVPVARLIEVATHLRDAPDAAFDLCSDVTATDWPPRAERFDVVYCLYSTRHRHRVRMKVKAAENQPVASVTSIWPAANWLEREVFDMFGVNFTGHPDRRRILMPEDWQGYPQRKDYPLEGPGELLMENPLDWLKLRQARDEADIE